MVCCCFVLNSVELTQDRGEEGGKEEEEEKEEVNTVTLSDSKRCQDATENHNKHHKSAAAPSDRPNHFSHRSREAFKYHTHGKRKKILFNWKHYDHRQTLGCVSMFGDLTQTSLLRENQHDVMLERC